MDRFTWYHSGEASAEDILIQAGGVSVYDGDEKKTTFESGTASLTPMRLIWAHPHDPECRLSLHHSFVLSLERHQRGLMRSGKIIIQLAVVQPNFQGQGPSKQSKHAHIKVSFRHGGDDDFYKKFRNALDKKSWLRPVSTSSISSSTTTQSGSGGNRLSATAVMGAAVGPRGAGGIVGIERRMVDQHAKAAENISEAFEDLSKLMEMARDMVSISKSISEKLRLKQSDISEDETIKFKAYLLSLGVSDPVTKQTHGSGAKYYEELARELARTLEPTLKECGGMMTLPEVYCRLNRARGLELLSPEDLLNACAVLDRLKLNVRLCRFESGVLVAQLCDEGVETKAEQTASAVTQYGLAVDAQLLGRLVGISVVLAKERLLAAEEQNLLCRDETVEGLLFYPNRFLEEPSPPAVETVVEQPKKVAGPSEKKQRDTPEKKQRNTPPVDEPKPLPATPAVAVNSN